MQPLFQKTQPNAEVCSAMSELIGQEVRKLLSGELWKGVHCADLGKISEMSAWLQELASLQSRERALQRLPALRVQVY